MPENIVLIAGTASPGWRTIGVCGAGNAERDGGSCMNKARLAGFHDSEGQFIRHLDAHRERKALP
jgi:hypothetical protein